MIMAKAEPGVWLNEQEGHASLLAAAWAGRFSDAISCFEPRCPDVRPQQHIGLQAAARSATARACAQPLTTTESEENNSPARAQNPRPRGGDSPARPSEGARPCRTGSETPPDASMD